MSLKSYWIVVLSLIVLYCAVTLVFDFKGSERKDHAYVTSGRRYSSSKDSSHFCQRVCTNQYRNVILLDLRDRRAGLSDRLYIIPNVLQLAGYLCAQVWVARPRFTLNPIHNNGQELNVSMTWNEFASFVYLSTTSSLSDGMTAAAAPPLVDWVNTTNVGQPTEASMVFQNSVYQSWFHVSTFNPAHIVRDWERVENASFGVPQQNGGGFVWQIRADFYQWNKNLSAFLWSRRRQQQEDVQKSHLPYWQHDNNREWRHMQPRFLSFPNGSNVTQEWRCNYVKVEHPFHIQQSIQKIVQVISQLNPINKTSSLSSLPTAPISVPTTTVSTPSPLPLPPLIGYLHIRRGDATRECNTSLARVKEYLQCSFESLPSSSSSSLSSLSSTRQRTHHQQQQQQLQSVVILFFSDERNETYRQGVARLVMEQQLQHQRKFSFIDLDHLVEEMLLDDIAHGDAPAWRHNNFYLYRLINATIMDNNELISFSLEQRRRLWCPLCTNITEQWMANNYSNNKSY